MVGSQPRLKPTLFGEELGLRTNAEESALSCCQVTLQPSLFFIFAVIGAGTITVKSNRRAHLPHDRENAADAVRCYEASRCGEGECQAVEALRMSHQVGWSKMPAFRSNLYSTGHLW